ncbi:MAG: PAS domain S-box protein, partial [Spirochaetales bacterium]|nr:PAS domain S-box protein [Spirochaetales bacterium]
MMNPVAERLTGWTLEKARGKPLAEVFRIVNADTRAPCANPVQKVLVEGAIVELANHTILLSADGLEFQISDSAAPIKDDSGAIIGIVLVFRDTTCEYVVRQEISETRSILESTMNAIPDPIGVLDDDYTVIRYNSAGYRALGVGPKEAIGKKCYQLFGKNSPCELCAVKESYRTRTKQYVQVYQDSLGMWVDLRAYPVLDESGSVVKMIEHFHDVSDYKRLEGELRTSEERLALALKGTTAGVWDWDMVNDVVYFSPMWKAMLGYEDHEVENTFMGWKSRWHPDDAARIEQAVTDFLAGKTAVYEIEHRLRHKDGSWRWILTRGDIIKDESGQPVRWVGTNIDLTHNKQMEAEIADKNEFLESILKTTRDGFWLMDTHGVFSRVNDAYLAMSGYSRDEFLALGIKDIDVDEHPDETAARVARIMETKQELFQSRHRRKDGSLMDVEISAAYLTEGDGVFVCFCRDITDRKRDEKRILSLLSEKSMLLQETHHRIKNDMHTIQSLLSMQADASPDAHSADVIRDAAVRLKSMMMLYDKLYRTESFETLGVDEFLRPLIGEIVGVFRADPPVVTSIAIDELRLGRKKLSPLGIILNELVTNSMKYAFAGIRSPEISVTVTKRDNRMILEYADNGVGLPETIRVDNSPGFGLQLIVLLVEQLEGTLRVERTGGTRFVIDIQA